MKRKLDRSARIVSFLTRKISEHENIYRIVDDDGYSIGFMVYDDEGEKLHAFGATREQARDRLAAKIIRNRINAALVHAVHPKS
ncbi:MAG TPA: hypothetical protein VND65_19665 [Candidatus Binatia bacterium]|nr:hypothetical protein [Candidatus Binatia bacterium]